MLIAATATLLLTAIVAACHLTGYLQVTYGAPLAFGVFGAILSYALISAIASLPFLAALIVGLVRFTLSLRPRRSTPGQLPAVQRSQRQLKVRTLMDRAGTPGERAAARAALQRLGQQR